MEHGHWQFAIDVGGTFTDLVACGPDGDLVTHKVLSSGRTKGVADAGSTRSSILDPARRDDPPGFWEGYHIAIARSSGEHPHLATVTRFDSDSGRLNFDPPLEVGELDGRAYELYSDEPSPLLAIRYVLKLGLNEAIGPIDLRLGSTRATNALLERKGARTVFVTTAGFRDILKIANQDRPDLFALHIRKPEQLAEVVIELHERIDARGKVLAPLDPDEVAARLAELSPPDAYSLAICLLNAYANPEHEEVVARVAAEMGFMHVSVSTRVSPLQRIVSRGDTTVVDAYLAPVIRDYVTSIGDALPGGRVRLMTSAGGLVDGRTVIAKDTLLSGPAGGVVGAVHVGRLAGFERVIGFDMGGTSTDVSRCDGEPEYQFETMRGGVRIVAPMLAIETVAAGGGSICAFDGQKLVVGPHSAGAEPGPACYGSGGPLTVTDMNLVLGRVLAEHFPFPLDRAAVDQRLAELARRIEAASGHRMSPIELAEGFVRIANENMAAAIRRISVARGYDPSEYALVTFGGAGAQHACGVARLLGIRQVVLSPLAGVLSAYGIGVADTKRFAEEMVLRPLSAETLEALETVLRDMEERLRSEIVAEGVAEKDVQAPVRMLDLRYAGEDSVITTVASDGSYAAEFERLHQQLYGYRHEERDIEIVTARVERVGRTPNAALPDVPAGDGEPDVAEHAEVAFDGVMRRCPVYARRSLRVGHVLCGPAVVIEDTSTIVVEPEWTGEVLAGGNILLTSTGDAANCEPQSMAADPVRLELFNNRFAAVAEQMGETLRRTALSTNVKERLDYSCAVFTAAGDLVVNAPHMPVHLGSMGECVKAVLAEVADLQPGDVILTNDPFSGGTHVPDLTCVTPLFDDAGRPLFFVASRAHHAEIGSIQPGSMPANSRCLADEGVIIRHFKVVRDGRAQTEALRRILTDGPHPSRAPDENIADINAQIAANQTGLRLLGEMMRVNGRDVTLAYMEHIRAAAEAKMRAALRRIPDGEYAFTDALDDGWPVAVRVTVRGDEAEVDFTGSGGVHPGNFNANPAIVASAVLYCFRCLIEENIPLNAGVLAPLQLVIPPGLLNPPADVDPALCPAVAAGNVETSQRLVDVIFGALGTVAASQGTMNNLIFGGEGFGYYETICGGAGAGPGIDGAGAGPGFHGADAGPDFEGAGAGPDFEGAGAGPGIDGAGAGPGFDGAGAGPGFEGADAGPGFEGADAVHTHMTNTRQTDPEVLEARYPIRLRRLEIRTGSGGAGKHRGGDGVVREIEFLAALRASIISQRRARQPYGLAGGEAGAAGVNRLKRAGTGEVVALGPVASFDVHPGDVLTIETPGGGGYGRA